MNNDLKNFYNKLRNSSDFSLLPQDKERLKSVILKQISEPELLKAETKKPLWKRLFSYRLLSVYTFAPLLLLIFLVAATNASAQALPGDWLYPVKLQVEQIRLLAAPTEQAKVDLQVNFARNRLEELDKITKSQLQPVVEQKFKNPSLVGNSSQSKPKLSEDDQTENSLVSPKRDKAEREVEKALGDLNKTRKRLETVGDKNKTKSLDSQILKFQVEFGEKQKQGRRKSREMEEKNLDKQRGGNKSKSDYGDTTGALPKSPDLNNIDGLK